MPSHDRTTARSTGRIAVGTIALGTTRETRLAALVAGRVPISLPVPDDPWALTGMLCSCEVVDDADHSNALDAALRGADVVVDVGPGRVAQFLEDIDRLGVKVWHPPAADTTLAEWGQLLDALARGATTEEAARRCHLSLRSAHRRLAVARTVLGVSTTAAAVSRWAGTSPDSR
jgi:hypothetical protein